MDLVRTGDVGDCDVHIGDEDISEPGGDVGSAPQAMHGTISIPGKGIGMFAR